MPQIELRPRETAMVARWMDLKMAIPMHYFNGSSDPQDFASYM